jgi:uncharacterized membrane protein
MESTDIGLYVGYTFLIVAVAAAIVLPLINAIKHPAGLLKSLAGVGALVLVFVIAYVISGSEVSTRAAASGINATSSKLIGAGLTMFYIVFGAAAVGVVFSEINKALK